MRRLDRLKETARNVGKVLRHWWHWPWYDVVGSLVSIAMIVAVVAAIVYSIKSSGQIQDVRKKRTVVNNAADGRFEYVEVDGHEYVLWSRSSDSGITHSPKCKCIQKDAPHEQ